MSRGLAAPNLLLLLSTHGAKIKKEDHSAMAFTQSHCIRSAESLISSTKQS